MPSYEQFRKRAPALKDIKPRMGDRRSGENQAEVAARRAAELATSCEASAKDSAEAARGAAQDAKDAKAAAVSAEAQVRGVVDEVGRQVGQRVSAEVGGRLDAAVAGAEQARSEAVAAASKAEAAVERAAETDENARQAMSRADGAAKLGQSALEAMRTTQAALDKLERAVPAALSTAQAAANAAGAALAKASERGVHVVSIALQHRTLVVKHSDGTDKEIFLPLEAERRGGRKGRGATGVGGGLNRTKVISLIEDRMVYSEPAYLDDQDSVGDVLTFTFSEAVDKAWVELHETMVDDEAVARVTVDGSTPDSNTGTLIHAGVPHPATARITTVKVLAESGKTISVWGYRR